MSMRSSTAAFGFAVLASACVPMPPVALDATPADLEILAGEWAGKYESAALGRRGSIEFKLKGGTEEARGDVLMVPSGRRTPYQAQAYEDGQHARSMPASEILTINFIRASDGSIAGRLDRYWDPDAIASRTRRSPAASRLAWLKGRSRPPSIAGSARPPARGQPARNARNRTRHGDSDV